MIAGKSGDSRKKAENSCGRVFVPSATWQLQISVSPGRKVFCFQMWITAAWANVRRLVSPTLHWVDRFPTDCIVSHPSRLQISKENTRDSSISAIPYWVFTTPMCFPLYAIILFCKTFTKRNADVFSAVVHSICICLPIYKVKSHRRSPCIYKMNIPD